MFCVEWMSNQLNKSGGVPERLIGAVLKTVERASVPWVRIPPPPPFRKSLKRLFFSVCEYRGDENHKTKFCLWFEREGAEGAVLLGFVMKSH